MRRSTQSSGDTGGGGFGGHGDSHRASHGEGSRDVPRNPSEGSRGTDLPPKPAVLAVVESVVLLRTRLAGGNQVEGCLPIC